MEYSSSELAVTEQLAQAIRSASAALEGLLVAWHQHHGIAPVTAPPAKPRPAPYRNDAGRHGVPDGAGHYYRVWETSR
jgi:predicted nucleic acid-binding Zn ribbon protein